jgi:hypothetical protein
MWITRVQKQAQDPWILSETDLAFRVVGFTEESTARTLPKVRLTGVVLVPDLTDLS